jgi:hypothetical protein
MKRMCRLSRFAQQSCNDNLPMIELPEVTEILSR